MAANSARPAFGAWLLCLAALIGLGICVFAYFSTGNGIHGTAGVLLVIVSTALMLLAALAISIWPAMWVWLRGLLLVLIALDIVGSGFAGYMLDDWWLVGAMALATIGWLAYLAADPARRRELPRNVPTGSAA